jgi:hypothetical protein
MDGDEIEAAMEVMEFIGEHYKIDFEFGRAGGVSEAEAIPSSILRGYNKNIKDAQTMAQALLSVFNQLNSKESINFEKNSGLKRALAMLDKVANTKDAEAPSQGINEAVEPKHFDICPGATALRKKLLKDKDLDSSKLDKWTRENDSLFKLEKAAIKAKKATPAQVKKAEDIASQIKATTKDMGKAVSSVAYVDGHVDKVKELA